MTKKKYLIYCFIFIGLQSLSAGDSLSFTHIIDIPATDIKDQGLSGTCWSFATCSFLESEYIRQAGDTIDLSEMFVVSHTYMDKSEKYIRMHGYMNLGQGGLSHDVLNVINQHGIVPEKIVPASKSNDAINHTKLMQELSTILPEVSKEKIVDNTWNKNIKANLHRHLGKIPHKFKYKGHEYTPLSFRDSLDLTLDNYIEITSYTHHPFYVNIVLEIPDNWAAGSYYNVPMEMMKKMTDEALESGYSVCWDGDVSEPGFLDDLGIALLLKKDNPIKIKKIKEVKVDQEYRQKTFDDYETTDDHLMHIIGKAEDQDRRMYYLLKNSWGKNNKYGGYLYMSEAYFLGKTIAVMVNKEALNKENRTKIGL